MTTGHRQQRGKYDDGTCFICSLSETPGEPLVESRWKLYRIWLCQHHAQLVEQRMTERGQSRDQVLEGLMDSMLDGLGLVGALGLGTGARQREPMSPEDAAEAAAGDELDDEDLEDMEYARRAATYRRCAVCTGLEDQWPWVSEYEVGGKTIVLCSRDEKAVLELVGEGMEWEAAVHKAGANLFRQLLNPEHQEELKRLRGEQEEKDSERGSNDDGAGRG